MLEILPHRNMIITKSATIYRFLSASICENKNSLMCHAKLAKVHIDSTLRFLRVFNFAFCEK